MHPFNMVKAIQAKTGLTTSEIGALLHISGGAISKWKTATTPRLFPRNRQALNALYLQLVVENRDLTPNQWDALQHPTTWVTRSRRPKPTSLHIAPRFTLAYTLLLLTAATAATLLLSL